MWKNQLASPWELVFRLDWTPSSDTLEGKWEECFMDSIALWLQGVGHPIPDADDPSAVNIPPEVIKKYQEDKLLRSRLLLFTATGCPYIPMSEHWRIRVSLFLTRVALSDNLKQFTFTHVSHFALACPNADVDDPLSQKKATPIRYLSFMLAQAKSKLL
jgi:hypothetical protein